MSALAIIIWSAELLLTSILGKSVSCVSGLYKTENRFKMKCQIKLA